MSAANTDTLLQLWAATLAPYDDTPPFSSHDELYSAIDATPHGGAPWQHVILSYGQPKPENAPTWMDDAYNIWYRDPHLLFKNMLENPEFANFFDPAPLRQYAEKGHRCYENFMSGDWAWKQAVSGRKFPLIVLY